MVRWYAILTAINALCAVQVSGQHAVYLQNNTALDYAFQAVQTGNITLNPGQYSVPNTMLTAYANKTPMLEFEPDTILSPGDTVDFLGILSTGNDTIYIGMRLAAGNAGNEVFFSGSGDGFDLPWENDSSFHSANFTMQAAPFTFKYIREKDIADLDNDALFAVQEDIHYAVDAADLNDPNVINVMAYNIQMTPIVSTNFYERATFFPPLISPYQDVVVVEEIFEDVTRINNLTPAMEAAGFSHYTTVLNDTALPYIVSPTNGGVLIYSRWPIETEAEIKYANCSNNGAFDCLASKGVKYAMINKLGKKYHIFGTHMEAGGSAADVQIRMEQYGEIAGFMDSMTIPAGEAVIFAGDFNTGPLDGAEYDAIRDSTDPVIPEPTGYFESTFSYADTGRIIDHVWGQAAHLNPLESFNKVFTFRSVDSAMWGIFDFSDHRTVNGRFRYPDIQPGAFIDTVLCSGETLTLYTGSDDSLDFQWTLNGTDIISADANTYTISNADVNSAGDYSCILSDTVVYGTGGDLLTQLFYPEGPDTLVQTFVYPIATVDFQDPCGSGMESMDNDPAVRIVPAVNDGRFEVQTGTLYHETGTLEIYNSAGQLIFEKETGETSIRCDVSGRTAGLYVLRWHESSASSVIRFIIY